MTSVVLRTPEPRSLTRSTWQPSFLFDDLLSWDPFADARLAIAQVAAPFTPAVEVSETANDYRFSVDLPGVEEKDVEITVEGERLIIRGKREAEAREEGATYHAYERSYGGFARTFTLPAAADMDRCEAQLHNGVLTITIPRRESHRPRKISLKSIGSKLKGILGGAKQTEA